MARKRLSTLANKRELQWMLHTIIYLWYIIKLRMPNLMLTDSLAYWKKKNKLKRYKCQVYFVWFYTSTWSHKKLAYKRPSQLWLKQKHSPRAHSQLYIGKFQSLIFQHFVFLVIFLWNKFYCRHRFLSMQWLVVDFLSHYRRCQNCLFHWPADNQEEWNGCVVILERIQNTRYK